MLAVERERDVTAELGAGLPGSARQDVVMCERPVLLELKLAVKLLKGQCADEEHSFPCLPLERR